MIARCQRGVDTEAEIVDPLGCTACRAIRQPNQPIQSDTGSLDPKSSKTSQFSVIRRFIGIESHASESYYHSCTVAASGANRLASQICHNRLFRKKLQQNILPMISTEVSSLAAHNRLKYDLAVRWVSRLTLPSILGGCDNTPGTLSCVHCKFFLTHVLYGGSLCKRLNQANNLRFPTPLRWNVSRP
jgi:hypothetical protein